MPGSGGAKRAVICSAQIPFSYGGGEILVESLRDALGERGWEVEVVRLPFSWQSREQLFKSAMAWRLLDLRTAENEPVDLVIATRFPSYLIRHPNKVVWLVHQLRQAYDLDGTPFGSFADVAEDRKAVEMIQAMDRRTLAEARAVYTISKNVAGRLRRHNGLDAEPLYPPPKLGDAYRSEAPGDYVFTAGRLDRLKRFELLVEALAHTENPVRAKIAGRGAERERLEAAIRRHRLEDRVELLGWVSDEDLVGHYARSLAVYYAPFDEDYGYVTVEAFKSARPVVTCSDAGGVLELVEDGVSGLVCPPSARRLARRLDRLYEDRDLARRLGRQGSERVKEIRWERVIDALTGEGRRA